MQQKRMQYICLDQCSSPLVSNPLCLARYAQGYIWHGPVRPRWMRFVMFKPFVLYQRALDLLTGNLQYLLRHCPRTMSFEGYKPLFVCCFDEGNNASDCWLIFLRINIIWIMDVRFIPEHTPTCKTGFEGKYSQTFQSSSSTCTSHIQALSFSANSTCRPAPQSTL